MTQCELWTDNDDMNDSVTNRKSYINPVKESVKYDYSRDIESDGMAAALIKNYTVSHNNDN